MIGPVIGLAGAPERFDFGPDDWVNVSHSNYKGAEEGGMTLVEKAALVTW